MNIIAETWMHCMLASHWDEDSGDGDYDPTDYISDYLKKFYGNNCIVTTIKNDVDYGYLCETNDKIFDITRGTNGKDAWKSNLFKFMPKEDGIHKGFKTGFIRLWISKKHYYRKISKPIICSGHSRGGPMALQTSEALKDVYARYSKCITFCSPIVGTKEYVMDLKRKRIDHIRIVNPGDIVDNVGAVAFFGKHHGKKILLPKVGKFHRIPILRHFFGHAYSSVTDAMVQYFYDRKMKTEAEFLKSIKHIAKI